MNATELSTALRPLISALHKGLRKQMQSVNSYSMTEIETISHLMKRPALLPSELASLTRITTQSMSQILKKMEIQGTIERSPSHDDKRKVFISLTSEGRMMVEKTRYDRDEWLKNLIDYSLDETEKEILSRALPVLKKMAEARL